MTIPTHPHSTECAGLIPRNAQVSFHGTRRSHFMNGRLTGSRGSAKRGAGAPKLRIGQSQIGQMSTASVTSATAPHENTTAQFNGSWEAATCYKGGRLRDREEEVLDDRLVAGYAR
eukprot:2259773-Rhodomonas_salina.2